MSSLRESLKKQLALDYSNAPKTYVNLKGLEMKWNKNENIYIGIDATGEEWITALQTTTIPIFSVACTNTVKTYGLEKQCKAINFLAICDSNSIKCRKCKKPFIADLNINPSSVAFETWKKLDV